MRNVLALSVFTLLVAGCGGHRAPAIEAAELVPANASAYVTVASGSVDRARAALAAFGAVGKAVPYLRPGRTARLAGGIVGFAQPADEKAFAKRLDREGELHATVRGWIVYARTKPLLDAVKRSKRSLADTRRYRRAAAALPQSALVRVYVSRGRGWRAAALSLDGANAKLEVHTPARTRSSAAPNRAREIPADAVVAIAGSGSDVPPGAAPAVAALSRLIGAGVGSLIASVGGPYVLYGVPGAPVPDVTFASGARSAVAVRALREFAAKLAGSPLPGGPGNLDLGPVTLHYGLLEGQLVLSDADDPAGELVGGPRLVDAEAFRRAAAAAGLPQEYEGLFYVDAPRTLAAVRALSGLAGRPLPPTLERALVPLHALLDWEATVGGVRTVTYLRMS